MMEMKIKVVAQERLFLIKSSRNGFLSITSTVVLYSIEIY